MTKHKSILPPQNIITTDILGRIFYLTSQELRRHIVKTIGELDKPILRDIVFIQMRYDSND